MARKLNDASTKLFNELNRRFGKVYRELHGNIIDLGNIYLAMLATGMAKKSVVATLRAEHGTYNSGTKYALTETNLTHWAKYASAFGKHGGLRKGKYLVTPEDLALLNLSPETLANLSDAVTRDDDPVKLKDVSGIIKRVKSGNLSAADGAAEIDALLNGPTTVPTLDSAIEAAALEVEKAEKAVENANAKLAAAKLALVNLTRQRDAEKAAERKAERIAEAARKANAAARNRQPVQQQGVQA